MARRSNGDVNRPSPPGAALSSTNQTNSEISKKAVAVSEAPLAVSIRVYMN